MHSCNRKGHEASECFLLHGYPKWFNEQQRNNQSTGQSQRGRSGRGNNSRGRGRVNTSRSAPSTSSGNSNVSSDQIAALISLLQNQQSQLSTNHMTGKPLLSDVIIDTGASHHMAGDLALLHNIRDIASSPVTFPNGHSSRATKLGTLYLNSSCFLLDVLYVPDFTCTLISVSKLLKQTGCIEIFTDTLCVLQDRFMRTLIGAGEEREGVYYFTGVTVARANLTGKEKASSSELWHRRLGDPAHNLLSTLPVIDSVALDFDHTNSCYICSLSKQTREVFQRES